MKLSSIGYYLKNPQSLRNRLMYLIYQFFHPGEPWISEAAIKYCKENLHPDMVAFEWGSGNSTVWFASRIRKLVSIEQDIEWHKSVMERLENRELTNVDCHFVPVDRKLDKASIEMQSESRYVSIIHSFPDAHFDFILVDGHFRMACVANCLNHIKEGGKLIIDNTNWLVDARQWGVPPEWRVLHKSLGYMSETTVWKKPVTSPNERAFQEVR